MIKYMCYTFTKCCTSLFSIHSVTLHLGGSWQCLEMFLAVTSGGEEWKGLCYWHLVDRDQRCYKHPAKHRPVLTTKSYLAHTVSSAEVEKSYVGKALRVYINKY